MPRRRRSGPLTLVLYPGADAACARRLLKAQKMRVGALATLKAGRQLGVPADPSAAAPAPAAAGSVPGRAGGQQARRPKLGLWAHAGVRPNVPCARRRRPTVASRG